MVDDRFVVKFAWSEVRAIRLWREGIVLDRLRTREPSLPLPELVVLSMDPSRGDSPGGRCPTELGMGERPQRP